MLICGGAWLIVFLATECAKGGDKYALRGDELEAGGRPGGVGGNRRFGESLGRPWGKKNKKSKETVLSLFCWGTTNVL